MQSNSDKQDYNKQDNNYSAEGVYPTYQGAPPPYSPYPQQTVGGASYAASGKPYISQTPLHQQKGIVITPVYQPSWNNKVVTPITTSLSMFLCISGFIYSLWGISIVSVQIAIVVNSFSTYYHGFWAGTFLIFGGIVMMIIAFRSSYPMIHLIRTYSMNLGFCTVGLVFSIVNYATSTRCISISSWYCDESLANNLKVSLLILFILGLIHTIINMIFISKEQKRGLLRSNSNVLSH